jgi:hypothetical protein
MCNLAYLGKTSEAAFPSLVAVHSLPSGNPRPSTPATPWERNDRDSLRICAAGIRLASSHGISIIFVKKIFDFYEKQIFVQIFAPKIFANKSGSKIFAGVKYLQNICEIQKQIILFHLARDGADWTLLIYAEWRNIA